MSKQLNDLRLRQLDAALTPWSSLRDKVPPAGGWVRAIRQALGMSSTQLAARLGLTRQGVSFLEQREADRTVTLATLMKAAAALDADLVYAIVPRSTVVEIRARRARVVAARSLERVAHTMRLEAQGVSGDEYQRQLEERQNELLRSWSRSLWDAEAESDTGVS